MLNLRGGETPAPYSFKCMRKIYKSKSDVSINIKLDSGKFLHVNFVSSTRGSYLITDEERIQKALESHPRFGKLFVLDNKESGDNPSLVPKEQDESGKKDLENETKGDSPKGEKLSFNDPGEAVDYLAEEYGISRTKLKSINSIKKAADSLGIEIEIEGM